MAVPNVNQLTSMLARLPDPALQQYAAMHKNDPYIMSLAVSESNRRKELRAAGQAAAAGQPQPKVADAALAQMGGQPLPEEMGIGALPANNMQQMADGGIAGYEGYDEGDSGYGQESVRMMADGGVVRYQVGGSIADRYKRESQEMVSGNRVQYSPDVATFAQQLAAEESAARQVAESDYLKQEQQRMLRGPFGEKAPAETPPAKKVTPTFSPDDYSGMDRRIMSGSMPNIPSITPPAKPAPTEKRVAAPRPGAGPAAAAAPEQSAAARYAAMQAEMGLGPTSRAEIDAQQNRLAESMRARDKNALEEFEKDVAARGEAFKGREERLAKREAGLGKQKDETAGLALLEAGLAIMSTPGKLAEAVGKGAQAGLKTYGAGLEKLRAAQEKMDDARDQIEEYRRNEANMTAKERRQFKNQIDRTETDIEKLSLDAAKDMYGFKREDAKAVFAASTQERLTDKEIAARLAAARISANQTPAQMQIAYALGKGDLEAGLNKMKAIEAGKFSLSNSYADYLKAFAGKETISPPLSLANYAAQFGAVLPR